MLKPYVKGFILTNLSSAEIIVGTFSQREHIKKKNEISDLLQSGKKAHFKSVRIYWKPAYYEYARLVVSVGKKVGHAPIRNRIKRMVREAFRYERTYFSEPVDMLVRVYDKEAILKTPDMQKLFREWR